MVIDSHQHFWKYNPVRDSWIDESMQVIRKDFLPKDLKPILEANNVDGCIAVQADQSEEETQFLLKCAAENSYIKGVIGWLDLRAENIEERLTHFSKNKKFIGVRHIVQAEQDESFMLKPKFINGIQKLEKFGLTYDILIHEHQLKQAIALVEKYPNQTFVLDHIAKPKISNGIDEVWKKNLILFASHANVSCKLSGMVTETKNFKWKGTDFTPFLDILVETFGMDRLLYASDWPVCLLAGEYHAVLQILTNYFIDFSKEDKIKFMGGNAKRIYNLEND